MFNFLFKKKDLKPVNNNIVKVELVGCDDQNRCNLYYDHEQDRFYDFVIPYREDCTLDILKKYFLGILPIPFVNGRSYPWKDLIGHRVDDVRNLKVLDQDIIQQYCNEHLGEKIFLNNGCMILSSCIIGKCTYSTYSRSKETDFFNYWNLNGNYPFSMILNKMCNQEEKDNLMKKLRGIEYKMVYE